MIKNYNECELRTRCWVIMSKDRKLILKGSAKEKIVMHIEEKSKKRVCIYTSKGKAISAIKACCQYSLRAMKHNEENGELEAVPAREIIEYDYQGMI